MTDYRKPTFAEQKIIIFGKKWSADILVCLNGRVIRFTALKEAISGITAKTLAESLQQLERDGLVRRNFYAVIPPKVEYNLTECGTAIANSLLDLHVHTSKVRVESEPIALG